MKPVTLTLTWTGESPRPGQWLCSGPRAKVAYEITAVREVKTKTHGIKRLALRCIRHTPDVLQDGQEYYEIAWHKRSRRR